MKIPFDTHRFFVVVAAGFLITACGGGSSGGTPQPDPIVDETSTDDLKNAASGNIGGSLDTTLDGVSRVTSGGSEGGFEDPAEVGVGGLWGDDAQSLINTSLDLGDSSNTEREGSRITIDPDDAAVCSEQLVGRSNDNAEFMRCQALVGDMLVRIDAASDTAGSMTYLFRDQPLVIVDYSASSNAFEINLGTLKTLIDADNELNPEFGDDSPLDTLRGAIRASAVATNTTAGAEAGSVSLDVTQAIEVASADAGSSLSLGIGKIFGMTADAATETASLELAVGALGISEAFDDTVSRLDMSGLTAVIDIASNADQLTVRNLGIGDGPLRFALDNAEVANIGLDTFGFTVGFDETTDEQVITLNGQLNLRSLVREVLEDDTVSDTLFELLEITAPSGTQLRDQLNGSQMVLSGGPLNYSLTTQDENGSQVVDTVTVSAGQCADDVGILDESDYEIVACE